MIRKKKILRCVWSCYCSRTLSNTQCVSLTYLFFYLKQLCYVYELFSTSFKIFKDILRHEKALEEISYINLM